MLTTAPAGYFMECRLGNEYLSYPKDEFQDLLGMVWCIASEAVGGFQCMYLVRGTPWFLNRSGAWCADYYSTISRNLQSERYWYLYHYQFSDSIALRLHLEGRKILQRQLGVGPSGRGFITQGMIRDSFI